MADSLFCHGLRSRRIVFAALLLFVLVFSLLIGHVWVNAGRVNLSSSLTSSPPSPHAGDVAQDPLALPGWREDTTWVTVDPFVQLHHWLQRMSGKEDGQEVDWARNKTILLLGDSVQLDLIWRLCDNHLHSGRNHIVLEGENLQRRDENEELLTWECVNPQTGLRLINGFLYGMNNYSRYPDRPPFLSDEWPPGPWGIEDRVPTLLKQFGKYNPDMVVVNSGSWDFKFLYKRDTFEKKKAADIEPSELREYGERLRGCLRMLGQGFPAAKHVFLQLHPLDTNDVYPKWWWAKEMASISDHHDGAFGGETPNIPKIDRLLPPLFTRRRVGQLASTYRRVAAEEHWDDLDYWKLAEYSDPATFFRPGDAIHPSDASIAVMLDWMLEKLWRWEVLHV